MGAGLAARAGAQQPTQRPNCQACQPVLWRLVSDWGELTSAPGWRYPQPSTAVIALCATLVTSCCPQMTT